MAALLALARVYGAFPGDEWALLELTRWRGGWLDDAAMAVSSIGRGGIGWAGLLVPWIPLAGVAGLLSMRRWADAAFLSAATLAPAVNLGLKELAARSRPDEMLALASETGYAFPSGHAVFAAAFFGALIILLGRWPSLDRRPRLRLALQAAMSLLIVGVGASRVWLGVHWPSDVVAGFLFGALWLAVLVALHRVLEADWKR